MAVHHSVHLCPGPGAGVPAPPQAPLRGVRSQGRGEVGITSQVGRPLCLQVGVQRVQWAGVGVSSLSLRPSASSSLLSSLAKLSAWPCCVCPFVPGHFLRASPSLFKHLSDGAPRPGVRVQVQGEGPARGNRAGHGPCSHFPKPRGPLGCVSLQTGLFPGAYVARAPQTVSEPQRSRAHPPCRVREDQSSRHVCV